jgi:hypothetical protein
MNRASSALLTASGANGSNSSGLIPSTSADDISRAVLELWTLLHDIEVVEWKELARDMFQLHTCLVTMFGNGGVFDGNAWEEQRQYQAWNIYLKFIGLRTIHTMSEPNAELITYFSMNSVVSSGLVWAKY